MTQTAVVFAATILLAMLTSSSPARAQEPLWGEVASTLGKGFANVTAGAGVFDYKPYAHHGGPVLVKIDRTDAVTAVEYGLQPDLDLRVNLPYVMQTIKESFGGQSIHQDINVLGEMTVGSRWRFRQVITGSHKDELALLAGLKLPTGPAVVRDATGLPIEPHLLPNSGNLGGTLGVAANRHAGYGGYWTSALATAETSSTRYGRGPSLQLHATAGRRVRPLTSADRIDWMGMLGLHYHWMGKDSEAGRTLEDSGGSVLSAELGIVGSKRNYGTHLGILLPLVTRLRPSHAPPRHEIQASFRASF